MAYRIVYAWEKEKRLVSKKSTNPKVILAVCVTMTAVFLRLMFPQTADAFRELLYPLGDEYTAEAFFLLAEHLGQGIPFEEAVMTFCRDIIANGR